MNTINASIVTCIILLDTALHFQDEYYHPLVSGCANKSASKFNSNPSSPIECCCLVHGKRSIIRFLEPDFFANISGTSNTVSASNKQRDSCGSSFLLVLVLISNKAKTSCNLHVRMPLIKQLSG